MPRACVIGGGFSGLACALRLLEKGFSVSVYESSSQLGGLALSFQKDGQRIHGCYHQILSTDETLLRVLHELKLYDRVSWLNASIYFYYDTTFYNFKNPFDLLRFPFTFFEKLSFAKFMVSCFLKKDWSREEHIDAFSWLSHKASAGIVEKLFDPLVRIKFGLTTRDVSAAWIGSRLASREGSSSFGYMRGTDWTYEVISALRDKILSLGGEIYCDSPVSLIEEKNGKVTSVHFVSGKKVVSDIVVSTLAPPLLCRLCPSLASSLAHIDYIGSLSLIVGVDSLPLSWKDDCYWSIYLHPERSFGGLFNLTKLNPQLGGSSQKYILNFFTNVEPFSEAYNVDEEVLCERYQHDIKSIFGEPLVISWKKLFRIPYVSAKYRQGYVNPPVRTSVSGLYLAGNYRSYPSVTSTGTAFKTGEEAAEAIVHDYS